MVTDTRASALVEVENTLVIEAAGCLAVSSLSGWDPGGLGRPGSLSVHSSESVSQGWKDKLGVFSLARGQP